MNSLSIVFFVSALFAMSLAQNNPTPSGVARRQLRLARSLKVDPNSMEFLCPAPLTPCPISSSTNQSKTKVERGEPWECLNLQEELSSCGKCGVVCKDIPNSKRVGCQAGSCKVLSCKPGYVKTRQMDPKTGMMADACA